MASCPGKKKSGLQCLSTVYRCKKCGSVGCDQGQAGDCSNQGFRISTCVKCGTGGQKEPIR